MDNFFKKIEKDIEEKIISSAKGNSIIKPFDKVFTEVRPLSKKDKINKSSFKKQNSIYKEVINNFLKNNPEFIKKE